MSITVHTENGYNQHQSATGWYVSDRGSLQVIASDVTTAEYAPGGWSAVSLDPQDDDEAQEAPQGGEKEDGGTHFPLPPSTAYRVMLNGVPFNIWSYEYRHADGTATLHARIDR